MSATLPLVARSSSMMWVWFPCLLLWFLLLFWCTCMKHTDALYWCSVWCGSLYVNSEFPSHLFFFCLATLALVLLREWKVQNYRMQSRLQLMISFWHVSRWTQMDMHVVASTVVCLIGPYSWPSQDQLHDTSRLLAWELAVPSEVRWGGVGQLMEEKGSQTDWWRRQKG